MADLDRAIAAAREALKFKSHPLDSRVTKALRDLVAAIDAARGEAVWQVSLPKSPECWSDYDSETTANAVAKASGNKCREVRAVYLAPPAAERDESLIDIGGESVPLWVVEYADALTTYFAERGGRSWAIGGVQSREQATPAAAVPEDVLALLRDLAPALDAYERSGRKSEIKDGALHWTLDARHYDALRLRSRVEDMLAALDAARGEAVPDGYTSFGEFRWACDCDERMKREWMPLYAAPPAAMAVPAANVTPMRQPRADLARLVESINAAVYANGDGLSVTEAIGALELAKLELLKEQEQ